MRKVRKRGRTKDQTDKNGEEEVETDWKLKD